MLLGFSYWFFFFVSCSILFVLQEHWWSWSLLAATMPATLIALSQYSCARSRKWCENTSVPNRPTQESQKPAQVLSWLWKTPNKETPPNTTQENKFVFCLIQTSIVFLLCLKNCLIHKLFFFFFFYFVMVVKNHQCSFFISLSAHGFTRFTESRQCIILLLSLRWEVMAIRCYHCFKWAPNDHTGKCRQFAVH